MHPDAIRALARAELTALRAWPQAPRCRAGVHVGGPLCHQYADPTTGAHHLPIDPTPIPTAGDAGDDGEGVRAVPFEVWAACPTAPTATTLETWAGLDCARWAR